MDDKGSSQLPKRKWVRLNRFAYDAGVFFVTICCYGRNRCFGNVADGEMCLNELGSIADKTLIETEKFYKGVHVLEYAIMPDHVHFIVNIERETNQSLALVVGKYKSMVSKRCLECCKERGIIMGRLWQSGYHEHLVRDTRDYEAIRAYIHNNPKNWTAQGKQ